MEEASTGPADASRPVAAATEKQQELLACAPSEDVHDARFPAKPGKAPPFRKADVASASSVECPERAVSASPSGTGSPVRAQADAAHALACHQAPRTPGLGVDEGTEQSARRNVSRRVLHRHPESFSPASPHAVPCSIRSDHKILHVFKPSPRRRARWRGGPFEFLCDYGRIELDRDQRPRCRSKSRGSSPPAPGSKGPAEAVHGTHRRRPKS